MVITIEPGLDFAPGRMMVHEENVVITEEGARRFHYMKAIPVKELCTTCHGTQVEASLLQAIKARYPEDAATGFSVGELRGAFTLSKPLD